MRYECAVSSQTVRWFEGIFVSVGILLSPDRLPMSMWTRKSFPLLSCGYNCLFGAILSGLRCSLSFLLGATVYAVYKLGLCPCCLQVALGCLSKASTASICFFRANVLVQLLKLISPVCYAKHTICTWGIYYHGKVRCGWDSVEWIICVQELLTVFQVHSSLTPISFGCYFLHYRFEIMLITNILEGLKFIRQCYDLLIC